MIYEDGMELENLAIYGLQKFVFPPDFSIHDLQSKNDDMQLLSPMYFSTGCCHMGRFSIILQSDEPRLRSAFVVPSLDLVSGI